MTYTDPQLTLLMRPVDPKRVGNLRGMAHMEAWDIRRQLIRVFGFGGWGLETIGLDLVAERETKQGDKSRWTVVYRAQVRLTIRDTTGREIARYEDGAAGDSVNQPSLGDAHDMAMKTALSQAMKRCAVNLGDGFGLSLYNDGSRDAVVCWSAAHPPAGAAGRPAAVPDVPEDAPVRGEQMPEASQVAEPEQPKPAPVDERAAAEAEMRAAADAVGFTNGLEAQFQSSFGHPIAEGTVSEFLHARDLLRGNAA
jgi:hypothetical protein